MKAMLIGAAMALAAATAVTAAPSPAAARGCLKGAVVGGVAGHYAGRHTLLGAGVGCMIGRHEANRQDRDRAYRQQRQYDSNGYGYDDGRGYGR
ncbi:MAG: hypothetical protein JO305_10285 [Alphaproteobacteria bacterium]|nr:hypothetical protein [Alphaproteobacteria bacterium]